MASARPSRRLRPSSRWAGLPVVVLAGTALAGCSAVNPMTSMEPYNASDGVRVEVSSTVSVENLLVLTAAEGAPGTLVGGVANRGDEDVRVTLSADGADDLTVSVPAGQTVVLGGAGEDPAELDTVNAAPGALLRVTVSAPQAGSQEVQVPVLDDTLSEYEDLVPAAS
ncbi:hypothetical protein [Cellulomonas fimi]|uniref:Lipoprotein n=1 Tax=Cellulomonas fimi TaxID=1708 RepID=A0A7Y0LYR3_CELFI|nr:hypothetical protein [Cellulomonas fimi]NMR20329.1 hypothetical protein [Cellulomonas fimi]